MLFCKYFCLSLKFVKNLRHMKLRTLTIALGIFAQISIASAHSLFTDSLNRAPINWYNLASQTHRVQGVSTV